MGLPYIHKMQIYTNK